MEGKQRTAEQMHLGEILTIVAQGIVSDTQTLKCAAQNGISCHNVWEITNDSKGGPHSEVLGR